MPVDARQYSLTPCFLNSGGSFLRIKEEGLERYGRMVKDATGVYMGPASVVCIAGFFKAIEENKLKSGDLVLLNTGEGCERALWFKKAIDDCK